MFVGPFVLISILVITMLVSDLVSTVLTNIRKYEKELEERIQEKQKRFSQIAGLGDEQQNARAARPSPTIKRSASTIDDWKDVKAGLCAGDPDRPPLSNLISAFKVFGFFALTWIMFFHWYPGEDRTWVHATYFSIITLSTVGFGAFLPLTEAGKVFAAFWMLFGCAALFQVCSAFSEYAANMQNYERWNPAEDARELEAFGKSCPNQQISEVDFFRFALKRSGRPMDLQIPRLQGAYASMPSVQARGILPFADLRARLEKSMM